MAKKWEEGIDYSVEIEKAKAAGKDTTALEEARAEKIKDVYGGNEPTMYGSNQTYKEASASGNSSAISNAVNLYNQYSGTTTDPYAGTNFHQDAINAAIDGNWDDVVKYLNMRDDKVIAQGGDNRGKTSAEIYAELWELYGQQTPEIPEFNSQYSSQIDQLLNSILNREEFSYDYTTDPTYHAYADKYKRLGDRAREDTLGNIAALNGGYASSWAASAASQAQNDYNQQLSDVIPTLYDAAYNRYMDDYNMDVTNLGLLQGVDNTQYDRYRDTVGDYQWKEEFGYKKEQDEIANNQWQQTFDWNQYVDEWNMSNKEATQKFDQMMSKWQLTGVADEEVAAALGIPVGATTESYYFKKAQLTLDQAKAAKGNGGGTTTTTDTKLTESIIRNAKSLINKAEDYSEGAKYILSAVTSAEEFYSIGSQAGIPTSTLDEVFDSFYDQALKSGNEDTGTKDYAYYAALMGQQKDPEAWLSANKYSIPIDIFEDLQKLLDY